MEKLEGDRGKQSSPNIVVATCSIPGLADGLAHLAFRGHAVLYDGGRRHPLTIEQWQAAHCSTQVSMH